MDPRRLPLLAMSARNSLLRFLQHQPIIGAAMPPPYSAAQVEVARTIWNFWKSKGLDDLGCAAWVANADGETSFLIRAVGDRGEAHGISQWHQGRRSIIQQHTGIDVNSAELADQCAACFWEVTDKRSWYHRVLDLLRAEKTLRGKVAVLVQKYEQSGSQDRDITRRLGLAEYWLQQFANVGPTS